MSSLTSWNRNRSTINCARMLRCRYRGSAPCRGLYQDCFAFLYASLSEGFGLPVLEAMTLGAHVITSNRTSLPEIVGTTALMVDPIQEEVIADVMHKLASGQINREVLRQQAITGAREFSWRSTAEQVHGLYQQVTARPCSDKPVVASKTAGCPHHKETNHGRRRHASTD